MYIIAANVVVVPRVITYHVVVIYTNSGVYQLNTIGM